MFEELAGKLTLDASKYVKEAQDAEKATEDVADTADETNESLLDFDATGAAAGAAMAGAGTAAQGLLDRTQDLRTSLDRTAASMGISDDAAQDLITSMTNATFSHDDAAGAMDQFASIGVDTEEEMRELVTASDALADATDTSATSVAENLAPVVKALDGDMDALIESQDAFTVAARESGISIEDLSGTISKLDFGQLEEMGLQTEEVTGLVSKFSEETGFTGRQLESNFNQAVKEADGDLDTLIQELGLGEDVLDEWDQTLKENEGTTQEHADAVADNVSFMDEMRSGFEDLALRAGDMLQPISAVAPAMQGLGVAMITLSTINTSAVIPSMTGVLASIIPLLPVLLPLIAAAGLLVAVWSGKFPEIVDVVGDTSGKIQAFLGEAITWLQTEAPGLIRGAIDTIVERSVEAWGIMQERVIPAIRSGIIAGRDWLVTNGPPLVRSGFNTLVAAGGAAFGELRDRVPPIIRDGITSAIAWAREDGPPLLRSAFQTYLTLTVALWTEIFDRIPPIVQDGITTAVGWIRKNGPGLMKDGFRLVGLGIRTAVLSIFSKDGMVRNLVENGVGFVYDYLREDAAGDLATAAGFAFDALVAAARWNLEALTPSDGVIVDIITDIASYLANEGPGIVANAVGFVVGAIFGAFEGLYDGLIGNSLIPSMFADIASYIKNDAARDLANSGKSAASDLANGIINKFNSIMPNEISVPQVTIGGGSIDIPSVTVAGETIGGGSLSVPTTSVGGQTIDIPALDTGGSIERGGFAELHKGEEVIRAAEVDRRGSGGSDDGGPEQIIIELDADAVLELLRGEALDVFEEEIESTERKKRRRGTF